MPHKLFSFDWLDLGLSTIPKMRGESLPFVVVWRVAMIAGPALS
jgi:hypothetical protein